MKYNWCAWPRCFIIMSRPLAEGSRILHERATPTASRADSPSPPVHSVATMPQNAALPPFDHEAGICSRCLPTPDYSPHPPPLLRPRRTSALPTPPCSTSSRPAPSKSCTRPAPSCTRCATVAAYRTMTGIWQTSTSHSASRSCKRAMRPPPPRTTGRPCAC
jgi:hypothetical protein